MRSPLVPDNHRSPANGAQWRQWALFGIAAAVILLILVGIAARKPWFWGVF